MPLLHMVTCSLSWLRDKIHDMPFLFAAFGTVIYWIGISYYHGQTRKLKHIPSMTSDLPLLSYLGTFRFLLDATDMINQGVKRWQGAMFKIPELFTWVVIVTDSKQVEELCKVPEKVLSATVAINEAIQMDYTFCLNFMDDTYHIPVIGSQLTRALPLLVPEVHDEMVVAFNELIPITEEWQSVRIRDTMMKVICRASNRAFVGLPLCRNPEFVDLNVNFTLDVVKMAFILRMLPKMLKPLVNSLISAAPKRVEHALKHLAPIIQARREGREQKGHEKPLDLVTWFLDEAKAEETTDYNLTLRIMLVNFSAINTSSMTFGHAFYYLATFPEYIQPLREEVEEIVKSEGLTKRGLDKMHKIDSFIKESQRMHPISNLLIARVAMEDFTFSNGTTIPRGTTLAVSTHNAHFNDNVFEEPLRFDGFRFSKMRENSSKNVGMVSSSVDYVAFGHGRHICPGRHFAACILKLMFAHIVLTYDVKLEIEGVRPPDMWVVHSCIPNPNANVLFRKRTNAPEF